MPYLLIRPAYTHFYAVSPLILHMHISKIIWSSFRVICLTIYLITLAMSPVPRSDRHFLFCFQPVILSPYSMHDPDSLLLIGHLMPGDQVHDTKQKSWIAPQLTMEL